MQDPGDVELERSATEVPPSPRRFRWAPHAAGVVLLLSLTAWYFFGRNPASVAVRTETGRAAAPPAAPARLPAEPGEAIDLPPLDASDALVRDLIRRLSSHPRVAVWLTTDHLIRNMTVVVVNIATGTTPARHLKAVAPVGAFVVRRDGSGIVIDPRSYARYDGHASAIDALDARATARLYATLKPRIDEAYRDLGAPDGDFDRTLHRAIVRLLETPNVEGDVQLRSNSVTYEFADPRLESLSQAQRQFLRMGPRNMRIVKAKLREVARYLGIPDESLPADTKL